MRSRGLHRKPAQYRVVPLGIDLSFIERLAAHRGTLRRELGLPPERPLVGIVGRVAPIKAHEMFVDAAAPVAAIGQRRVVPSSSSSARARARRWMRWTSGSSGPDSIETFASSGRARIPPPSWPIWTSLR